MASAAVHHHSVRAVGACSLAAELDGFTLMAENEFFQLFVHEETAEVRLFDKRTEVVWSTNPSIG